MCLAKKRCRLEVSEPKNKNILLGHRKKVSDTCRVGVVQVSCRIGVGHRDTPLKRGVRAS